MPNNDFAKFIDELRESRNLTREELVEDIISLRQYYRFIKGESSLKNEIIGSLLDKIGVSHQTAYVLYNTKYNEVLKQLNSVYGFIYNLQYKKANDLLDEIDPTLLETNNQRLHYQIMKQMLAGYLNKTPYNLAAEKVIELINYPNLLDNEFFAHYEIVGVVYILKYLTKQKDFRFAYHSYNAITNKSDTLKLVSNQFKIPFYLGTAQMLGFIEEYEKSLKIANLASQSIMKGTDISSLLVSYYLQAISARNMDNTQLMRDNLTKVYSLLRVEGNQTRINEYNNYISKNFNLKESDLIEFK